MKDFFSELRRRKIWWVTGVYIVTAWIIIQVISLIEQPLSLPGWFDTAVIVLAIAGLPLALILAWVQESQAEDNLTTDADVTPIADDDLGERVSIAVLPFDDLTNDPALVTLADGMTEDVISLLSYEPFAFIAARNSSAQFRGGNIDIREVGQRLKVRYVLEGSVRKIGENIRVTAQLIEAADGGHIWSERYDIPVDEIVPGQDHITEKLSISANIAAARSNMKRLQNMPEEDLGTWGLLMASSALSYITRPDREERRRLQRKAIDLTPNSGIAHACLAEDLAQMYSTAFSIDPTGDREEAVREANLALKLAPDNVAVVGKAARLLAICGETERAVALARRLWDMAPFRPFRGDLAIVLLFVGDAAEALEIFEELDKFAPPGFQTSFATRASAKCMLGRYEEALLDAEQSVLLDPQTFTSWIVKANLLSHLDRMNEARDAITKLREIIPDFSFEAAIIGYERSFHPISASAHFTMGLKKLQAEEKEER